MSRNKAKGIQSSRLRPARLLWFVVAGVGSLMLIPLMVLEIPYHLLRHLWLEFTDDPVPYCSDPLCARWAAWCKGRTNRSPNSQDQPVWNKLFCFVGMHSWDGNVDPNYPTPRCIYCEAWYASNKIKVAMNKTIIVKMYMLVIYIIFFLFLFSLTACGSSTRDVKTCPSCSAPTERNGYDFMHGGFMTTERHCPECGWNK